MRTIHSKKSFVVALLSLSAIFVSCFSISSFSLTKASDSNVKIDNSLSQTFNANDYQEVSSTELVAKITACTTTPLSKYLNIQFESMAKKGYIGKNQDVFISSDNDNINLLNSSKSIVDGYVYKISPSNKTLTQSFGDNKKASAFFIPKTLQYKTRFTLNINKIVANTVSLTEFEELNDVVFIYIPNTVTTIESQAFNNVPDNVYFCLQDGIDTSGFETGWQDSINPNQIIKLEELADKDDKEPFEEACLTLNTKYNNTYLETKTSLDETITESKNFILGYQASAYFSETYPLTYSYSSKRTTDDEYVTRFGELDKKHPTNPYDGVGKTISSETNDFVLKIDTELNEEVDLNTICFYNIFYANKKEIVSSTSSFAYVPDTSTPFKVKTIKNLKNGGENGVDIKSIFSYHFNDAASFGNYTSVSMIVDKVLPCSIYSIDDTHQKNVDNGTYIIRYTLTDLNNSSYIIKYKKGNEIISKTLKISSPSPVVEIGNDKNNVLTFTFKNSDVSSDFSREDLVFFGLTGVTVNIHLYNKSTNSVVMNTSLLNTFGTIDVLNDNCKFFNISAFITIFAVIFSLIYVVSATILFFVLKNKFKNDEFRRIKPLSYLKSALLGYVGGLLIVLGLNYIFTRFFAFNNSIPSHNPMDFFVVIFGILAVISFGFFIRFIVVTIKANKKRKEAKRLHLDLDVNDDGTK